MAMNSTSIFFLAIIFISSSTFGDVKIYGHIEPLENEQLPCPVVLDCGANIIEWRSVTQKDIQQLNKLCTHALSNFFIFAKRKGKELPINYNFYAKLSLIPYGTNYRDLNDLTYRFRYRTIQSEVSGYTDYISRFSFIFSDQMHREFKTTFVHELFHSMSIYYGLYDLYPGSTNDKVTNNEELAIEFTEWLGYGR